MNLDHIRVVLCDTRHPGNIGAVARAMKTMGLTDLRLVRPARFPHGDASRLAVGAIDVIDRARVEIDLADAIAGCTRVYGTGSRPRRLAIPTLAPRAMAAEIAATEADVALVFGGEESGLGNTDLSACTARVEIPADPGFASLNLAAAVQVLCYECRLAGLASPPATRRRTAPLEAFEHLMTAFDHALEDCGYYANKNPRLALDALRRLLHRAAPDRAELQMLRGMLARLGAARANGSIDS
jgi:tRNA (cytidine32/uridine32-2'-O)-methyltransferase